MITFLIIYFIIPIMFFGIATYVDGKEGDWTREVKVLGLWKLPNNLYSTLAYPSSVLDS